MMNDLIARAEALLANVQQHERDLDAFAAQLGQHKASLERLEQSVRQLQALLASAAVEIAEPAGEEEDLEVALPAEPLTPEEEEQHLRWEQEEAADECRRAIADTNADFRSSRR